jgi:head-tail adaptor
MIAGRLRTKLRVKELVEKIDKFGAASSVWVEHETPIWAECDKYVGKLSEEVGEHFADYTAVYRTRINHKLIEHWRVIDVSTGCEFVIDNIILNKERGLQTLYCSKLNP